MNTKLTSPLVVRSEYISLLKAAFHTQFKKDLTFKMGGTPNVIYVDADAPEYLWLRGFCRGANLTITRETTK